MTRPKLKLVWHFIFIVVVYCSLYDFFIYKLRLNCFYKLRLKCFSIIWCTVHCTLSNTALLEVQYSIMTDTASRYCPFKSIIFAFCMKRTLYLESFQLKMIDTCGGVGVGGGVTGQTIFKPTRDCTGVQLWHLWGCGGVVTSGASLGRKFNLESLIEFCGSCGIFSHRAKYNILYTVYLRQHPCIKTE